MQSPAVEGPAGSQGGAAAAMPLPWIAALHLPHAIKESIAAAATTAAAELQEAAQPAERVRAVADAIKGLYTHDSASTGSQVQMLRKYAAMAKVQQMMMPPADVPLDELELPPRPADYDTNEVTRAEYDVTVRECKEDKLEELAERQKEKNKAWLGEDYPTWDSIVKAHILPAAAAAAAEEEGSSEGPPPPGKKEVGRARSTLYRHVSAVNWYIVVASKPEHYHRPVLPTVAAMLYDRYKQITDEGYKLQLISAVKELPAGEVTKGVVTELLKSDDYKPANRKVSVAQKAVNAVGTHLAAAQTALERAKEAADQAKQKADAAVSGATAARQLLEQGGSRDTLLGTAGQVQEHSQAAGQAAAAAQASAARASTQGLEAVKVAGKYVKAREAASNAKVVTANALKAAKEAAEHASRAATADEEAKSVVIEAERLDDDILQDIDLPGGGAAPERAARQQDKRQRSGAGGPEDDAEEDDAGRETQRPSKRARCVKPGFFYDLMKPQAMMPDTHSSNSDPQGEGDQAGGDRAQAVKQFSRRLVCGLYSCCPELLSDVPRVLGMVESFVPDLLQYVQSPAAGATADASSSRGNTADLTAAHEEIALCKDGLELLVKGQAGAAADMFVQDPQSNAVLVDPNSKIPAPICLDVDATS